MSQSNRVNTLNRAMPLRLRPLIVVSDQGLIESVTDGSGLRRSPERHSEQHFNGCEPFFKVGHAPSAIKAGSPANDRRSVSGTLALGFICPGQQDLREVAGLLRR